MTPDPVYFRSPAELRRWLEKHHEDAQEIWVGFWKKATGEPSLTWSESVDEALCFGWIDGIRKSIDERRYTIRFTPRRPTSKWSLVNVRKMETLERQGRVREAGRRAFAKHEETGVYSYEELRSAVLPEDWLAELRADPEAVADWDGRPPGYRKSVAHWITSAKREATRRRRFEALLECSREGRKIPPLDR